MRFVVLLAVLTAACGDADVGVGILVEPLADDIWVSSGVQNATRGQASDWMFAGA